MLEIKPHDPRKPKGGWASGNYVCKCQECNERYQGAKRSWLCADCAYNNLDLKDLFDD